MKKLLGILVLGLLLSDNAYAKITVKEYLDKRQNDNKLEQEMLDVYIQGVGKGYFWSAVIHDVINQDKIYCAPSEFKPTKYDYRSFIDAEIVYAKSKGALPKDHAIEMLMGYYLNRTYPYK